MTTKKATPAPAVTMKASQFRDLVAPVIPLAGDLQRTTPVLDAVHIDVRGKHIYATGCDRYRVGIQRIEIPDLPAGFEALVSLQSLRSILSIFKATRRADPVLSMTVVDNRLTVEVVDGLDYVDGCFVSGAMAWPLVGGAYPSVKTIITTAQATKEPSQLYVNPAFLADFKAAQKDASPMLLRGSLDKAVFVQIGPDFVGAIMSVKVAQDDSSLQFDDDWSAYVAPVKSGEAAA